MTIISAHTLQNNGVLSKIAEKDHVMVVDRNMIVKRNSSYKS